MDSRLLDVTAYTTLDYVTARAEGPGWTDDSVAVLDATGPEHESEQVELSMELDPSDLDNVKHHADTALLSPAEARALATDLEEAAAQAEETESS